MSEWVDVNDRLPEADYSNKSDWVLVFYNDRIDMAYYRHSREEWVSKTYGVNPAPSTVTHWRLLPTPPGTDAAPGKAELGREAFAQQMRDYAKMSDTERAHAEADELMCSVLRKLGYGEGVAVFLKMGRWYA